MVQFPVLTVIKTMSKKLTSLDSTTFAFDTDKFSLLKIEILEKAFQQLKRPTLLENEKSWPFLLSLKEAHLTIII